MLEVDPTIWFSQREVKFAPPHFTSTQTKLTPESLHWIRNNIRGRYSILSDPADAIFNFDMGNVVFEDPKDAMLYELKWS
jgi:hypothetical protein